MKKLLFILSLLIPVFAIGQFSPAASDILKAEVHGDTVILRDDTAFRNCGAVYTMQVVKTASYTLKWVQKDYGSTAYCYCNFNLAVTIDSLKPGNYTVNTYHTIPGSGSLNYIGVIHFTIGAPSSFPSPSIVSQSQSSCLVVGVPPDPEIPGSSLKIFPNPTSDFIQISTDLTGEKSISITDMTSNRVVQVTTDKQEILIDLRPLSAQMYFITLKHKERTMQAKILKTR